MREKNLSDEERNAVAQFLMVTSKNGHIGHGKAAEAAAKWNIGVRTATRIWVTVKDQIAAGVPIRVLSNKPGAARTTRKNLDEDAFKSIQLQHRQTCRRAATQCNVSKSTIHRLIKKGKLRKHSNAIKPFIRDANKVDRVEYACSNIRFERHSSKFKFRSMYNAIHLDEKWFFLSQQSANYILLPEEDDPYRTCQHKGYIPKVMFICAVARPIIAENGDVIFDGKIGIFPLIGKVAAQRKSKNRPKGTIETKAKVKVNRDVMTACLVNDIIPTIKRKWPPGSSKKIWLQQDNAPAHPTMRSSEFLEAANSDGFEMKLRSQPANSPDLNILDLGFFRSIQSLQWERTCKTVDELLEAVYEAFEDMREETINKIFISLQAVMIEVMKCKGNNNYSLPHKKKDALARVGLLQNDLDADASLVRECVQFLTTANRTAKLGRLIRGLETLEGNQQQG